MHHSGFGEPIVSVAVHMRSGVNNERQRTICVRVLSARLTMLNKIGVTYSEGTLDVYSLVTQSLLETFYAG